MMHAHKDAHTPAAHRGSMAVRSPAPAGRPGWGPGRAAGVQLASSVGLTHKPAGGTTEALVPTDPCPQTRVQGWAVEEWVAGEALGTVWAKNRLELV